MASNENTNAGRRLGLLAPIGLISYSLYLWHSPHLGVLPFVINNCTPGVVGTIVLKIVSIIIATLSYRYVHQPFRNGVARVAHLSIDFACIAVMLGGVDLSSPPDGFRSLHAEAQAIQLGFVMRGGPRLVDHERIQRAERFSPAKREAKDVAMTRSVRSAVDDVDVN